MLKAYCDCSMRETQATAAAIIVTSKYFIDYMLKPLPQADTTYHGELQAVIMAMELINKNFDTPQKIKILSDCATVVHHMQYQLNKNRIPPDRKNYSDWVYLMSLCKNHTVYIEHVYAHADKRSYNMLCDVGARMILPEMTS